jgi:fermentation-respiration switch protein FrsA (DUF1100 family)
MLTTAAWLAAALVLFAVVLWLLQRRLIYLPLVHHVPPAAAILPGAEEIQIATVDGLSLGGWFVPATEEPARATVLVFNGNAGNRALRAPLAAALASHGLQVLLFDYRGYGGNPGSPSEKGLLADGRGARDYLAARPEVDPERVVYLGESLGAAVAVAVARDRPPAALVLRSPFDSLVEIGKRHYPFLPVGLMLADRYPARDQIRAMSCPVLVLAGEADSIVPPEHSRRLYEAAPSPKRFVSFPGVDHNHPEFLDGPRFVEEIVRFIEDVLESGS